MGSFTEIVVSIIGAYLGSLIMRMRLTFDYCNLPSQMWPMIIQMSLFCPWFSWLNL